MKFTYNWLKEYVDVNLPAKKLADILTMSGLEIDSLDYMGKGLDNIFTVKILGIKQHPNADKLSLCEVTDGAEIFVIVCGAKNMKSGDIVALAKEGAKLPNGIEIKPTKIRGIVSNGMLCSLKELGLANESAGIMLLPENTKIGEPLVDTLGMNDYFFEIGLTPNRSDCLCLLGIAKEVSILTGAELKPVNIALNESNDDVSSAISVEIANSDACHRYTARVLKNVVIKESDPVIKSRLEAVGIRSINNIVDITNYVMFVYGQPQHAFDYDLVQDKKIIVRNAAENEKFVTLDEKERILNSDDLLICDGGRGIALAGVMGGMNTEVSQNTKNILLESAYFNPANIRKTSKRLGLTSESSHRFERGVNPDTVSLAADYAAALMQTSTGCVIMKGIADKFPVQPEVRTVTVRYNRVNKILGTKLTPAEIVGLIKRLKLEIKNETAENISVVIPQERHDLVYEIDIIEEIARIYGYDNIIVSYPKVPTVSTKKSKKAALSENVRNTLVNNGFFEAINYSFYAPKDVGLFSATMAGNEIKILNPLTEQQSIMRMSLIAGLMETAKRNINHKNSDIKLFEHGKVFFRADGDSINEINEISGIISGIRYGYDWCHEKKIVDFFDIKGIVELVLENIKLIGYNVKSGSSREYLHPAISAELLIGNDLIGDIGEIHPDILESYDIDKKIYAFRLDFDKLCKYTKDEVKFEQIPKYPYVNRDIALVVDKAIATDDIVKAIRSHSRNLVEDVKVFDVYEGAQIGEGNKSLAFSITYRDLEKTLTDDDVNEVMSALSDKLEKKFNGQVRK